MPQKTESSDAPDARSLRDQLQGIHKRLLELQGASRATPDNVTVTRLASELDELLATLLPVVHAGTINLEQTKPAVCATDLLVQLKHMLFISQVLQSYYRLLGHTLSLEDTDDERVICIRDDINLITALVVDSHQGAILRYAKRRVSDIEIAKEIAQETFLTMFRQIQSYDKTRDVRSGGSRWLYGIARNLIRRYFDTRPPPTDDLRRGVIPDPSDPPDPDTLHHREARYQALQMVWSRMCNAERAVLLKGRPLDKEIADGRATKNETTDYWEALAKVRPLFWEYYGPLRYLERVRE